MAIEQTISINFLRGTQNLLNQTVLVSTEGELNKDVSLTGAVTDHALGVALTIANVKSLVILADKDCTLKTNSTTAPQETISLVAGVPFVWTDLMPLVTMSEIFAGNLTEVYATTTETTRIQWYTAVHTP